MPEGHDPFGANAMSQRIDKELRCAASHTLSRQRLMQIPAEASQTYIVSNPVTHTDTVLHVPSAAMMSSRADSVSRSGARAGGSGATGDFAAASASASPRSVSRSGASGNGLKMTTVSVRRSDAELLAKIDRLEATLLEERQGRTVVQTELQRLTELLEHVSSGAKAAAASVPRRDPQPLPRALPKR